MPVTVSSRRPSLLVQNLLLHPLSKSSLQTFTLPFSPMLRITVYPASVSAFLDHRDKRRDLIFHTQPTVTHCSKISSRSTPFRRHPRAHIAALWKAQPRHFSIHVVHIYSAFADQFERRYGADNRGKGARTRPAIRPHGR